MRAKEKFHYLAQQNLLVISNYDAKWSPAHERSYINALKDGFEVKRVVIVRGNFEITDGYRNEQRSQSIKRRKRRKRTKS